MTHGFFLQMGGFVIVEGTDIKEVLSPNRLDELYRQLLIAFPNVAEEEIQHRSKADGLSTFLVVIQVTWFITQYTDRIVQGLATTQLELVTLAFTALNGVMYLFWWNKPFSVRLPIPVHMLDSTMAHGRNYIGWIHIYCRHQQRLISFAFQSPQPSPAMLLVVHYRKGYTTKIYPSLH